MKINILYLSIKKSYSILFNVFLQSQIASHAASGALLFNQLLVIGCPCEVRPDAMISSAITILKDFNSLYTKFPFELGVLDGLVLLLNQMMNQVLEK